MLTKKHFEMLANVAANVDDRIAFEGVLSDIISMCKESNARFCTQLFEKKARELRAERMGQ